MRSVFGYSLRRSRGQIIGWGLTLMLLAAMMVSFYDTIAADQAQWQQLLDIYPKELLAFFGGVLDFTTPQGFLSVEFFSFMPLVLGVFAILAGGGLLVEDEEAGRMDLILGQPVRRRSLFFGRLAAFVVTTTLICLLGLIGILGGTSWSTMELELWTAVKPFISVLAMVLWFGTLTLMLSLLLPSRRMAGMVAGVVLVAGFFVTGLAQLSDTVQAIADFSPITYYQGGEAMSDFKPEYALGLLALALVFALIAWWRFERREIRVGGEGGWSLPFRRRRPVEPRPVQSAASMD